MLDIQRLRVFRTVVATGSVSGAATSLGYTPSAVSQHVSSLQRETGLVLIERRGRGIVPTPAGTALAGELGSVFERLAEVDRVIGDLRAGRTGALTVRYFASAGAAWIPPVAAALVREFPDLRLELRLDEVGGEAAVVPDLEIFVEGASVLPVEGYHQVELLHEPYLVVLPGAHRLAGQSEIPLVALRDEVWVDNDFSRGPCRQVVLDACAAAGFSPAFRVETHDYPTAMAFVAEGVGITVLPRLAAVALPAGVRAVPVADPVPRRRIMLRTRNAVCGHAAVQRATELLRDRARAAGGSS